MERGEIFFGENVLSPNTPQIIFEKHINLLQQKKVQESAPWKRVDVTETRIKK